MSSQSPLVERREQLLGLVRAVTGARAGRGTVAVVAGPVGSGKSVLLSALCEESTAAGVTVLRAGGSQAEQNMPWGVVGQLLRQVHGAAVATIPPAAQIAELCAPFLELAEDTPLLLCVDDAHFADAASWQCLMFLVRRLGTARMAVVLAERSSRQHPQPALRAELLRQPHSVAVTLGPLTERGVAALVESRLGVAAEPEIVADCTRRSGGSPLLAHSLVDDFLATDRQDAFVQAVISCLYRSEPPAREVARGIALLGGGTGDPRLLERLLGLSPASAGNAVHALESAGLLVDGGFRSDTVRSAVLLDTDPCELSRLQHRAARLLYDRGASESEVADRLLATDEPGDPWTVEVLCDAARQVLAEGEAGRARRYVEQAQAFCADSRQRAQVLALLAGVDWQSQPGHAVRHLPALTSALIAGELSTRHGIVVVTYLLRHGRSSEARRALAYLLSVERLDPRTSAGLRMLRCLLAGSYPGMLADLPAFGAKAQEDRDSALVRADPRLQAAAVFEDVLAGRADENTLLGAEQVLRDASLTFRSWEEVESALLALIYADEGERAGTACDRLLDRLDASQRGWRPPLLALRSHIALRQGRPADAERSASTALREMPASAWGATIGLPLGSLLTALTVMGRYDEAAELLSRPVPHTLYQTRHGLHYLHARGGYRLATGNLNAALDDFGACGDLMREWNMDLPGLVPWRSSAALVHLRLDRRQQSAALVEEELARLRPGPSRARGVTLRVSALSGDLRHRPALLRQAVREFQRCDDLVEQAFVLADLGHAYQSLGDNKRSRAMMNKAWYAARQAGAEPLCRELGGMFPGQAKQPVPIPVTVPEVLSEAERRVAELAAMGHTNREISRQLFITVSTVEQHLTRVYRKLKVGRRADLLDRLQDPVDAA